MNSRKITIIISILILMLLTLFPGCTTAQTAADKIGAAVTITPQAEFVRAVGGDKVDVTVMIPPGASPHTYEPSPGQITALAKADLYFQLGSGMGFELAWMDRFISVNENLRIVNHSEEIELITAQAQDNHEHEEEYPAGTDPHIWLSPENAGKMVKQICRELASLDPQNEAYYTQNRDNYLKLLEALDKEITDSFREITNRQFIVFHPAWGYFARDYGLTEIPIEVEGKEPSVQEMANVVSYALEHQIKVIFASPQFTTRNAEMIAQSIQGKVLMVDPLAEDYIQNLQSVTKAMLEAMR